MPVCGLRLWSVPIDRTTMAIAPFLLGDGRALAARRPELAVAGAVLVGIMRWSTNTILPPHRAVRRGSRASTLSNATISPVIQPGGSAAAAERSHDQFLREGRDDLRRSRAARPDGDGQHSTRTLEKPSAFNLSDRPGAGAGFRLGRGEALADLGRQALDDIPGVVVVLQRLVAQRGDLGSTRTGGGSMAADC